ncbi:MAG: FG-GAP repeat protein, partial [Nanoarchaeota archaeon]|nr:FG-GAP repeat protein [Nanoarchaeota archaeon]
MREKRLLLILIFLLSVLLVIAITPSDRVIQRDDLSVVQIAVFNSTGVDALSCSLASADVNYDDYDDLIMSACYRNLSGGVYDYTGQIYILYGSSSYWSSANISLIANVTINGTSPGVLGFYKSLKIKDVNNDSYLDLIVAAPY